MLALIAAGLLGLPQILPAAPEEQECVILLHGLGRSTMSMKVLEWALEEEGFRVVNQGYPSRSARVEVLAEDALPRALEHCEGAPRIHFVTHSMGGILLWHWLSQNTLPNAGRAVMLGPPGAGSEIVDRFGAWKIFDWINGPAGAQLGSGQQSVLNTLPRSMQIETAVIAGNRSWNPFYSYLIDGPDDGKVSVASAFDTPARERLELPVSHTWMMTDAVVISRVLAFLRNGEMGSGGVSARDAPGLQSTGT